jgi:ABC-type oligopeptide transport system ATPase subunit
MDARGEPTFTAVKNVNLDIKDGEFMVLVAPSSCGKSTTSRVVRKSRWNDFDWRPHSPRSVA